MKRMIAARWIVVFGLLGGTAAMCAAQTYTPPPPPLTTLPACPADKDAKKRASRKDCDPTIYPSEKLDIKGKKAPESTASPAAVQPAVTPAAKANPYPGNTSADMPSDAAAPKKADAPPAYPGDNGKDIPYNPANDPEEQGKPVPPHDPAAEKRAAATPAGKANPFPGGATPDMPTDATEPPAKPDESQPGAPSSSSGPPESSSSTTSSSDDAAGGSGKSSGASSRSGASKNPDDDDDAQPKLTDKGSEGKRNKKVIKPQSDTDRVDEDLSVAKFYGQSGNFMGAYLRAKDAVKIQPEYPDGHFALGEAAKRLKKNDEAAAEFQAYLKLAPDGKDAKAAERALEKLK